MSRFLVTGGAGFIGSNIVEKLLQEGNFVRVLDNFSSGKEQNLEFAKKLPKKKFELIRGDIRDSIACDDACKKIDYVLHQAALRSVPRSMKEPFTYNDVNINGVVCVLRAASKNKVKRFVFASSSSVYGDAQKYPSGEELTPLLISPYALTKLAGEYYCRIFSEHYNLETACLRYFNVFGPKQALDDDYAVVIPKFIHCILNNKQPPIFGTGKQSRDFTFVDNVVSANILAATTPNIKHEIFNVANGNHHSVLELVELLNKLLGKNIKPQFLAQRQGDVFKTHADISKIKKTLKYKPLVEFEEGLGKTMEYFNTHRL